jgi:hypothetical protein
MNNSVRQLQPFGRHFALNGPSLLIPCDGHHFQTMRGETRVFFVFIFFRDGHNSSWTRHHRAESLCVHRLAGFDPRFNIAPPTQAAHGLRHLLLKTSGDRHETQPELEFPLLLSVERR